VVIIQRHRSRAGAGVVAALAFATAAWSLVGALTMLRSCRQPSPLRDQSAGILRMAGF
jgi:hypothetical protein